MPEVDTHIPRYLRNTEEVLHPEESQFSGEVPSWLNGTLYASAPGIFDLEKGSVTNWLDGYAIISKFQICGRKLNFHSKYLQSNAYKKAREAKRPVLPEFGTPPWTNNKNIFSKLLPFGPYDCTDNVIGTIFKLGSNLYTAGDTCYFHEISPTTLDHVQRYHTTKAYGMNSISSQPLEDYNGDVYLIGIAIQPTFRYTVLKMQAKDKDTPLEKRFSAISSFSSRWMFGACPCRNFGMTDNYIIMIEMPVVLNLMKLAGTYVKGYCATDWLDWRLEDGVRFYIIHKESGNVIKTEIFSSQTFFTPSVINAYEDGEEIILDLISMPNLDCNQATVLQNLRNRPDHQISPDNRPLDSGTVHRYIIPLIKDIKQHPEAQCLLSRSKYNSYRCAKAIRKGEQIIVTSEPLTEPGLGLDFQVINPNYRGKRYSFSYNTSGYISTPFSPYAYGIVKLNVDTKEVKMWNGLRGQVPSEPVFIPSPNPTSEDDGILLTLVKMERSYEQDNFVVVVDAKNMTEIARAYFKSPVAGWFHASFYHSKSGESGNRV